ncbi:unnamed protein product [marine sediment metagenome]|uniref:Uncharacterized protein n=1 Tax=marine sediment metagenome TaxID=412755 RepID=X1NXL9_9ZZZZ
MDNNHKGNHEINLFDVMIIFMLKAPDRKKAIAALEILFGPILAAWAIDYKKQFKSYQDWRTHLIAALDNAQEKVDAQSR